MARPVLTTKSIVANILNGKPVEYFRILGDYA